MHSSYSLHIPKPEPQKTRRRKRKFVSLAQQITGGAFKYRCISCQKDVYFSPGHELVCTHCASRTVEKVREVYEKRVLSAR